MIGWAVTLNGVMLTDCALQEEWDALDCFPSEVLPALDGPPDGLGLPSLRTEDVTYYQRDGVTHFSDFYEPRLITVTGTLGPVDAACEDGGDCSTVRQQLQDLVQAWKRSCCDTELVIYPDCYDPEGENRDLNGPFGVVGRPRVFDYQWENRRDQIVNFTARFDAVDQRMYVLDACGTPGYTECETIEPGYESFALCFETVEGYDDPVLCFGDTGVCFDTPTSETIEPTAVSVGGTENVFPTITLYPPLVAPRVENITTGEFVQLDMTITDTPVTINTEDGTAFDGNGNSLTHLLRGSLFLSMVPGNYEWRLISNQSVDDPGYMTLCWRPTVVMA